MLSDIYLDGLSNDALANSIVHAPEHAEDCQAGDGVAFPCSLVGDNAFGHRTALVDFHFADSRRDALSCLLEVLCALPAEPGVCRIRQEIEADPQAADALCRGYVQKFQQEAAVNIGDIYYDEF